MPLQHVIVSVLWSSIEIRSPNGIVAIEPLSAVASFAVGKTNQDFFGIVHRRVDQSIGCWVFRCVSADKVVHPVLAARSTGSYRAGFKGTGG